MNDEAKSIKPGRAGVLAFKAKMIARRKELESEHQNLEKFYEDVNAAWDTCRDKYQTLSELMGSPEGIELRKHYWRTEAEKRGEL
jgi:hypothetical protein